MASYGTVLNGLHRADVKFLVVGARAANAHGVTLPEKEPDPFPLEIVPEQDLDNLDRLAELATAWQAQLLQQPGRSLAVRLTGSLFPHFPALPLTSSIGDLWVLTQMPPAPVSLADAFRDAEQRQLDGEPVRVASVEHLLAGALGSAAGEETIVAGLRDLQDEADLKRALADPDSEPTMPMDRLAMDAVERAVIWALSRSPQSLTVRELYTSLARHLHTTYRQVRAAAENLVRRGAVTRRRTGTANSYRISDYFEEEAVRSIAALLATTPQPDLAAARALDLLRSAPPD